MDLLLETVADLRGFQAPPRRRSRPPRAERARSGGALLCSHVRLYGFAGTLIVDGHEENARKTAHITSKPSTHCSQRARRQG